LQAAKKGLSPRCMQKTRGVRRGEKNSWRKKATNRRAEEQSHQKRAVSSKSRGHDDVIVTLLGAGMAPSFPQELGVCLGWVKGLPGSLQGVATTKIEQCVSIQTHKMRKPTVIECMTAAKSLVAPFFTTTPLPLPLASSNMEQIIVGCAKVSIHVYDHPWP